jgi:hypothetical protein
MKAYDANPCAAARLALLRPGKPHDVIAWRGNLPITRQQFLRDLAALAARLPDRAQVLNHCEDRYRFMVGLAAALLRGQVSLFPSNRAPEVLAHLAREYPAMYCLTDQHAPEEAAVMEVCAYDTSGTFAEAQEPAFAPQQSIPLVHQPSSIR